MAETFKFENSFGRILGVAHTSMFRYLSKLMKNQNLPITPEQFSVLSHLWQKDGLQQTELALCTNRNREKVSWNGETMKMTEEYLEFILQIKVNHLEKLLQSVLNNQSKTHLRV